MPKDDKKSRSGQDDELGCTLGMREDALRMRSKGTQLSQLQEKRGLYKGIQKGKSSPKFVHTNQNINLMDQEHTLGFCRKR